MKPKTAIHDTKDPLLLEAPMRALVRPFALSLGLLLASALAPPAARAQAAPDQQYPAQPGYQQTPAQPAYPQPAPPPPEYQQPQVSPDQQGYQQQPSANPQQYPAQPGYQQPQPGYPQPPQGYQQPQPGYPQPQPGYQQPPQGYPQPQPGYQQPQAYPPPQGYAPRGNPPPPGYYAPPPRYGRRPTYAPPPAYAPPPPVPPYRFGFLWMPYIGVNVPVGDTSNGVSTGLRLGGIFGFNVGPFLSLNGELTIDVLNLDAGSGQSATGAEVDLAFSPLFHLDLPGLEFVVGPKLGFFGMSASSSRSGYPDSTFSGNGLAYGFNAGFFIPLGRIAIGGLFNFTGRSYSHQCYSNYSTNYSDVCGDVSGGSDDKFMGFSGALMY